MEESKCFVCGNTVTASKIEKEKPLACSKSCKSDQKYKKEISDWRLKTRGYPSGYHSIEEYKKSCYDNEVIQKTCTSCFSEFVAKRKDKETCKSCTEKIRLESIAKTKTKKYGTPGYNNKEKAKLTCEGKYGPGITNPLQATSVREKIKKTCLEKYGVDNPSKSDVIIEKIANTFEAKYGVRNVFMRTDIMTAAYERAFGEGITNPQQVEEICQRTYETRKKKYDLQGAVPKGSLIETNLKKYGAKQFFGSEIGKMTRENLIENHGYTEEDVDHIFSKKDSCSLDSWIEKHGNSEESLQLYKKRVDSCDSSSFDWALRKANGNVDVAEAIFVERQLKKEHKPGKASKLSLSTFRDVESYLVESHSISADDIWIGDDTRREYFLWDKKEKRIYFYDFTIPSKKIIIEYNGCYYHPKNKEDDEVKWEYDQRKLQVAKENGFFVVVVWDDTSIKKNQEYLKGELNKCLTT